MLSSVSAVAVNFRSKDCDNSDTDQTAPLAKDAVTVAV